MSHKLGTFHSMTWQVMESFTMHTTQSLGPVCLVNHQHCSCLLYIWEPLWRIYTLLAFLHLETSLCGILCTSSQSLPAIRARCFWIARFDWSESGIYCIPRETIVSCVSVFRGNNSNCFHGKQFWVWVYIYVHAHFSECHVLSFNTGVKCS